MNETLVLDQYTVEVDDWVWNDGFGAWTATTPRVCELIPGENYRMTCFDTIYEVSQAQDISSLIGMPMVAIGNLRPLGLATDGSMFIIGDGGTFNMFVLTSLPQENTPGRYTFSVHHILEGSEEPVEPEIPSDPNDAVILSYSQSPIVYKNIPKVWLTHPDSTEEDVKLVPFTYGEAVAKSVDVDFSGGDMAVDIPEGELVTALTVKKPDELAPENIPEGMYIAGVGPGTYIGNGNNGSSGDNKSESIVYEPAWIDDVCFWDYDGTLIQHFHVNEAAAMTELPEPPTHEGLTFLGWNYTLEQVQTAEYPQDIGAIYIPVDGKTHLHLSVTNASYRAVPLNWTQTVSGGVSIDWGDGTSKTTVSGTGVVKTTHTYSAIGEYDVVITVADGCLMTLGGGTAATTFVGSGTSTYRNYLTKLYIGQNVAINPYGCYYNTNLEMLTLPDTITAIPDYGIARPLKIPAAIIPSSVAAMGNYSLYNIGNYSLTNCPVISIPESISTLGTNCFNGSFVKRLSIPRSITAIPNYTINSLYMVLRVFMSDEVTELGNNNFYNCYQLEVAQLPNALKTIGNNNFYYALSINKVTIPPGVETIGTYFFSNCMLTGELVIPASVTSIGSNSFQTSIWGGIKRLVLEGEQCPSIPAYTALREMVWLSETVPASFKNGGFYCEIYVPDAAFDAYYAKLGSDYKHRLHPLSEYPGEMPKYK